MNTFSKRRVLFVSISVCFWMCRAHAGPVIGDHAGQFTFEYKLGDTLKKIPVHYYAPPTLSPGSRIVFVLHGSGRSGDSYRDIWKKYAIEYNFLVLCPEFTEAEFPGWWSYNGGNIYDDAEKKYVPREQWSFNVVEGLFDFVREERGMIVEAYCLFGHSAGAQFVHRMVLLMPEARFSMAIANAPGSYTYPLLDERLIEGLQFTGATEDSLKKSFQKQMIIQVGAEDVVSKTMPKDPDDFQDGDRLWQAKHFLAVAKREAKKRDVALNWRLRIVPDADHNSNKHDAVASRMAAKSDKVLAGKKPAKEGNL